MYERDISRVYSCMISRINIIALHGLLKAHAGCDSAFYVPHICMDGVGLKREVDYFPSIFITDTDMSGNMAYDVTKSGQNAHETHHFSTLRPRQNGRHLPDDIFKYISWNENAWIPIKISLKFVPKGPTNNIPVLVQIMVWRRPGAKPLSEPMMGNSLTHIWVTQHQWV